MLRKFVSQSASVGVCLWLILPDVPCSIVAWNRTLDQYIRMHVLGMQYLISLAQDCRKLQSFVHVSTAFTNCEKKNIIEKVYPSHISYKEVLDLLNTCKVEELEARKVELLGDKYNA